MGKFTETESKIEVRRGLGGVKEMLFHGYRISLGDYYKVLELVGIVVQHYECTSCH